MSAETATGGALPDKRLDRFSTSEHVRAVVNDDDAAALQMLLNQIRSLTWQIPPYDVGDKVSATLEHLWNVVYKKILNACSDGILDEEMRPKIVSDLAASRRFDFVPYEVRNRLIDEARKASAQKRGGDGIHIPILETLTFDGELAGRDADDPLDFSEPTRKRPRGSRTEHITESAWNTVTERLQLEDLKANPWVDAELGSAARLFRFFVDHANEERWPQADVAQELDVSDRTIRTYRSKVLRFVKARI